MKDMKIIEALENSGILLKGVSKTIENETKEQRGGFLSMLLGTLGASLLGNLLTGGKGMMRAGDGIVRAGDGIVRAGEGSRKKTKFTITFSSINKYRNNYYIKMNLHLMVYILEIIYQIKLKKEHT